MTRLESMKYITTLEQGVAFLKEYDFGRAIEGIDICTYCTERVEPRCSVKQSCKDKLLQSWLAENIAE